MTLLRSLSRPVTLREGQTLVRTGFTRLVSSVADLRAFTDRPVVSRTIFCAISLEILDSLPPEQKPSGTSPSLGETIITGLTSRETTAIVNVTAIATALIGTFTFIAKQWSKKQSTDGASLQQHTSQPSETDIVTIRLRMTHGPDHEFEEWLTEPDRLKHYIDVFNQPSSSIQPLYAIFVQRNGRALKADVSKGAQNNLQLNELLGYLNIDSADN